MSLRKANITWNCNQLTKMIKGAKISFDNVVQRSFVWDKKRKSDLIESLIIGYPIPPIYAKRSEQKVYDILDGKQRLTTISSFLEDEFPLNNLKPVEIEDEATGETHTYELSDKKFSELAEDVQEILKTATLTVYYFDDITEEEEREMFRRINAGKPLSTKEKNIANCKDLESIIEMGGHGMFEEMFTKKSYEAKSYVPLIVKMYVMLTEDIKDVSFESKVFNQTMANVNISQEEQTYMNDIFDLVEYVHSMIDDKQIAKKLYKETHLVSLVPFLKKTLDERYVEDIFADWVMKFFDSGDGASISPEYNEACLAGSAKPENIQKRHKALEENFNEYYSKIENYKKED